MPGQTWQCRVPGQPQTALEASGRELSGAQPVALPATGLWGSWLPRGAPTLLTQVLDTGPDTGLFPGLCRLWGVPGLQLCTQTPELGAA